MSKPFDYAAAKAGAPVQTRDGRKARIVCWDKRGGGKLVVLIAAREVETAYSYDSDGRWCVQNAGDCCDLVMAPRKRTVWVNLYPRLDGFEASVWSSEQQADQIANNMLTRIGNKAWPLEIED